MYTKNNTPKPGSIKGKWTKLTSTYGPKSKHDAVLRVELRNRRCQKEELLHVKNLGHIVSVEGISNEPRENQKGLRFAYTYNVLEVH